MASVKISCPKCVGTGITGTVTEAVCSQCKGVGTIAVNDTDTLATISAASATPLIVTAPIAVPLAAVRTLNKGK